MNTISRMVCSHIMSLVLLASVLHGCSGKLIKNLGGMTLPGVGAEARLIEKHGWVATSEQAMRELIKPSANWARKAWSCGRLHVLPFESQCPKSVDLDAVHVKGLEARRPATAVEKVVRVACAPEWD